MSFTLKIDYQKKKPHITPVSTLQPMLLQKAVKSKYEGVRITQLIVEITGTIVTKTWLFI